MNTARATVLFSCPTAGLKAGKLLFGGSYERTERCGNHSGTEHGTAGKSDLQKAREKATALQAQLDELMKADSDIAAHGGILI